MEDQENNVLIFKKARTPIKKRVLQKPLLPRRQSKDLKQKSLPDLNIQKNKLTEYFKTYHPYGKETLQQDIIKLKEKNNQLTNQNTRLKTIIMNLERDNMKFQKLMTENKSPVSSKVLGECNIMSMKQLLRQCRKQLMDQKNQNISIKKSLKYSRMGQLELQNKYLKEETLKLRNIIGLDNGAEYQSQKQMQEETISKKFNLTLSRKVKSSEEKSKAAKFQKDQMVKIQNLKKTIKEKDQIINSMKIDGLKFVTKEKAESDTCKMCQKYQSEINQKNIKIKQLQEKTKCVINNNSSTVIINNPPIVAQHSQPTQHAKPPSYPNQQQNNQPQQPQESGFKMKRPSPQFYESLRQFLRYRFQAHHLSLQQLKLYIQQQVQATISVDVFAELCLVQPFCIGNRDYLGALIGYLFYQDSKSQQILIKDTDNKPTQYIISKLQAFLGDYQILDIKREEQMYMQIAELITNYQKHIETALVNKRNGDGTISKKILQSFLVEIELEKQYIDFIISQIILDSIDMDHLSYNSLFDIFIISTNMVGNNPSSNSFAYPNQMRASQLTKSVYSVMPVKELDEEYEQSQQSQHFKELPQNKQNYNEQQDEQQLQRQKQKQKINIEQSPNQDYNLGFNQECQEIQEYEPIHDWTDQPIEQ